MIEDHWDTRQEYIKQGNELAALEQKQEQEKKEKEKAMKEMQEKMTTVTTQVNNVASSSGGDLMPVYVPQKQETNSNPTNTPVPMDNHISQSQHTLSNLDNMNQLQNKGRAGFQNNMQSAPVQRPFGQNMNPFQGNRF